MRSPFFPNPPSEEGQGHQRLYPVKSARDRPNNMIHLVNLARHAPDLPETFLAALAPLGETAPWKFEITRESDRGRIEDTGVSGRLVEERRGRKSGPFQVKEDGKSPLSLG